MKRILFLALTAITAIAQAQISEVHTFDKQVLYNYEVTSGTPIFYSYDTQTNEITLYNTDFSLRKQGILPLPTGYKLSVVQWFSSGLFTTDSRISFIVTAFNSTADATQRMYVAIYDENAQLVQSLGYAQQTGGVSVFNIGSKYYLTVSFGLSQNADFTFNYQTKVYSLNVTTSAVQQITQIPSLPYPNPSNGIINLPYQLKEQVGSLYVYDLNGQQMERKHITNAQDHLQLNVSQYPAGQYIYVVEGQTQSFIVK